MTEAKEQTKAAVAPMKEEKDFRIIYKIGFLVHRHDLASIQVKVCGRALACYTGNSTSLWEVHSINPRGMAGRGHTPQQAFMNFTAVYTSKIASISTNNKINEDFEINIKAQFDSTSLAMHKRFEEANHNCCIDFLKRNLCKHFPDDTVASSSIRGSKSKFEVMFSFMDERVPLGVTFDYHKYIVMLEDIQIYEA